ncbi:MAG: glycosyl hydrolase family 18 protein, partial [Planctomycetota bacterium]|nr:glycosyl hydrolase family 18 protein [Planctomycetota bacterium]
MPIKKYLLNLVFVLFATASSFGGVTFTFTNQWTTGGEANFHVTNDTSQTLQGWTLEFDWGVNITSVWSGGVQSHIGNHYTISNLAWNGSLAPGASADIGCVFTTATPGVAPTGMIFSGGSGVAIPVITSLTTVTARVGQPFVYQITATNSPTSFGATGLPAGMAISSSTGLISGTTVISGNFTIQLQATNAGGNGSATLALAVSNCPADGNGDGSVDGSDLASMLGAWGQPSAYDINADGITDGSDLAVVLGAWGSCVPSGNPGYEKMPTVAQRKIVGYYPNWGIYQKNFPVTSVRADRINVINYAFLIPLDRTMPDSWDHIVSTYRGWDYADYTNYLQQPAGTTLSAGVGLFDEWADVKANTASEALTMSPAFREGSNFSQLRDLKQTHNKLRTLVSIGGWTLSTPFFSIARSAQKRLDFAKSAVYVTARYGFDGIDIDWEYPGGGGLQQNGIADPATDGANYLLLLQALRDELDHQSTLDGKTYYLTIAAPGGDTNIANMNPAAIAGIVDWINIMTYDFHGGWDAYTGLNSPMVNVDTAPGTANWSVTGATNIYLNGVNGSGGVAPSKLVLGAPLYGRGWSNVEPGPNGNGLGQAGSEATSPGLGESEFPYKTLFSSGFLTYSGGVFSGAGGYTRYWDMIAQVPYLYSPTAKRFITYDDPQSMNV